jgi:hypothetical protein
VDEMVAPLDSFPLRPLGEHPVFLRRHYHNELASNWSCKEMRLFCPPVELMAAVVRKLRISSIFPPPDARLTETIMASAGH